MRAVYKVLDIARLGLHSLWVHKVRSTLTALGIIFGVWGVIAMLAINEGASYEAQRALRELGTDNIIITSTKPTQESTASGQLYGILEYGLTHGDVDRLVDNIPKVRRYVTVHLRKKSLHYRGKNASVAVIATEPKYLVLSRGRVARGRFITTADMRVTPRPKAVCVITAFLARALFSYEEAIGKEVRVGGEPFRIVGILAKLPETLAGEGVDVDKCVVIPGPTGRSRFGEYSIRRGKGSREYEKVEVSQLILQMADERAVLDGAAIARSLLKRYHDSYDYKVKVPRELIEQQQKQQRLWNIMFFGIASVSLLVGGIGIMNIMLASVTERTREIGIRRALGAKRRDIVAQFLVEAVALTAVGGALGIGFGLAVPELIERFLGPTTIVSASTLLLPFIMAVVVGLVSGLYPAFRAARLDPIVALRHE